MKPFVLAGSLALLGACGTSLEDHEALWAAKGPAAYHYSFAWSGFLPRLEAAVMVRSGVVSDTIVTSSAGFPGEFQGWTVEQLFQDVRHRLDDSSCKTRVQYEEALGYPTSVFSDCGIEGDGWRVTDFAAD
jgi:hypothetical protein